MVERTQVITQRITRHHRVVYTRDSKTVARLPSTSLTVLLYSTTTITITPTTISTFTGTSSGTGTATATDYQRLPSGVHVLYDLVTQLLLSYHSGIYDRHRLSTTISDRTPNTLVLLLLLLLQL